MSPSPPVHSSLHGRILTQPYLRHTIIHIKLLRTKLSELELMITSGGAWIREKQQDKQENEQEKKQEGSNEDKGRRKKELYTGTNIQILISITSSLWIMY